jgi:RNA 2',3'-cyclic 3'-phosphodiesterase
MAQETMRLFIAIDIDKKIRDALSRLQQKLKTGVDIKKGDVKWVEPDNIHLTLKFLGEVKDEKVADICNIVKDIADKYKSFDLDIEQLGCFGGRIARVIWVGTGTGSDNLIRLAKDIDDHLALAGWGEEEKEFAGHLTICRIKNQKAGAKLAAICEDYKDFKAGVISVDSVLVYQSQLTPRGPIYSVVGNYKLQ